MSPLIVSRRGADFVSANPSVLPVLSCPPACRVAVATLSSVLRTGFSHPLFVRPPFVHLPLHSQRIVPEVLHDPAPLRRHHPLFCRPLAPDYRQGPGWWHFRLPASRQLKSGCPRAD